MTVNHYQSTVEVDPSVESGRVSPLLFGWQHGEVADPIFRGLWAEMLSNRKFGGHDEPAAADRTATVIAHIRTDVFHEYLEPNPTPPAFGVVNPWYRVVESGSPYYRHDNSVAFVGGQAQRIELQDANGWCGIAQAGLRIQAGERYVGHLVARAAGSVRARVSLTGLGGGPETVELGELDDSWERRPFTFETADASDSAEFRIEVSGSGTAWFGVVSLMPDANRDGFRRDVLEAVADLQPAVIRWGGNTSQYYRWEDGLGPRDLREPFMDAWDSLLTHDFATHEFVHYCQLVGARPFIVVNAGDGSPEEAARWVEYCNAPANRGEARRRADHGALDPFGVRYWSLGNEAYGNWVVGHCDPETYGRRARRFAEAMRASDPDIELILVGDFDDPEWNRRALREAGPDVDHLSLHWYPEVSSHVPAGAHEAPIDTDERAALHRIAGFASGLEDRLRDAHRQIAEAGHNEHMGIALDEWSLMLKVEGDRPQRERWGRIKDMRDAVFVASAMNVLVRNPELVALSTYTRLHRYGIYTDQRGFFYSPDVLVLKLLREELGSVCVPSKVHTPDLGPEAFDPVPALDVSATRDDAGDVVLVLVNRDPERTCRTRVEIAGGTYRQRSLRLLEGRVPADTNSMTQPSNITARSRSHGELNAVEVPPWGIVVLRATPGASDE